MKAVLDHVGIAVASLEEAVAFYRDALGLEIEATEDVASQGVRAHFVGVGGPALELLEATSDASPDRALRRPAGVPGCTTSPCAWMIWPRRSSG